MNIIIYALGRLFNRYRELLDWSQIIAFADKNLKEEDNKQGIPIIHPASIYKYDYNYIVIFSSELFEEIRLELIGEYGVLEEKIIPWTEIIQKENICGGVEFYKEFCVSHNCQNILDISMSEIPKRYLVKEEFCPIQGSKLEGVINRNSIYNSNLYDYVYLDYADCNKNYDVILINADLNDLEIMINKIVKRTNYILFHTRYLYKGKSVKEVILDRISKYGRVSYISTEAGIFWIIDLQEYDLLDDVNIFVVTHKQYNFRIDNLYKPLCVGDYQIEGYLSENMGENIVYLNKKINECSALYWIWKNTKTKYVGLNHYRRYFYNDNNRSIDNYLDIYHISKFLKSNDIIMSEAYILKSVTVQEQIKNSIDNQLYQIGYSLIRSKIEKKCPDYLQEFDSVMSGYSLFPCNMFVTKREILNKYCEWLFSFLIEAAEEIDVDGYDAYSQRVIGFFAERMWTVWFRKNKLKIKELPYTMIKSIR